MEKTDGTEAMGSLFAHLFLGKKPQATPEVISLPEIPFSIDER